MQSKEITLGSSSRKRTSAIVRAHFTIRTQITREILDVKKSGKRQTFDLQPLQEGILGSVEMLVDEDTAGTCHTPAPSHTYTSKHQQIFTSQKAKHPPCVGVEVNGSENKKGRTQVLGDKKKKKRKIKENAPGKKNMEY